MLRSIALKQLLVDISMCELFSKTELKWHLKFKKHKPNQSKPYVIKSYAIVDKTKQKIQRKISNIDEVMVG